MYQTESHQNSISYKVSMAQAVKYSGYLGHTSPKTDYEDYRRARSAINVSLSL